MITTYKNNKKLEKKDRKKLLNCLIEHFFEPSLNRYKKPNPRQQEKIAGEIVEVFPTENKEIYFISRKKGLRANPTGLLFNRLNNLNRKRRNSKSPKSSDEEEEERPAPSSTDTSLVSMKKKMKLMQNGDTEAGELWKNTFSIRQEEIRNCETLETLLDEWQFYKQSGGEQFVSKFNNYVNLLYYLTLFSFT